MTSTEKQGRESGKWKKCNYVNVTSQRKKGREEEEEEERKMLLVCISTLIK